MFLDDSFDPRDPLYKGSTETTMRSRMFGMQ